MLNCFKMMKRVYILHKRDPNFPFSIIEKIEAFIGTRSLANS